MTISTELQYMPGTSEYAKYLVIARKGPIALGIRAYPLMPGNRYGRLGKTYLPIRLHSAANKPPVDSTEGLPDTNVVNLGNEPGDQVLENAWPKIEFENANSYRAATTLGMFLRGDVSGDPKPLVDELLIGTPFDTLAGKLLELVEPENTVLAKRPLAAWLKDQYAQKIAELQTLLDAAINDDDDGPGFQAVALKKLYEQHMADLTPDKPTTAEPDDDDEDF